MSNGNIRTRLKRGFTIVELLVVAPIVILTIGAFVTVIVNMTGDVLASRATNVLTYNIQDALNRIEEDVKLSTSFIAGNNVSLESPQGFDNATANFRNNDTTYGNMLILNTLATTGNPISTTSGLVYLDDQPNNCTDAQVNQNKPLTINVVYFIKDGTLWRRTIMPLNYTTAGCTVPWQQPSCNPSVSNAFCKAEDVRLVDNITTNDFKIEYFNTANSLLADTVANDTTKTVTERNTALQSLTTVSASITVNTTAAGRAISQSGTIRATKLDVNASSIAPIIIPVTPASPTVSGSVTAPVSTVFTWPLVQGATSYSVEYNINGGAWTTGFTNQNTTTYTVPACNTAGAPCSTHNDTVNVRVTATNIAGTSGYSTTSQTIPQWVAPTLQNNWSNYNGTFTTAGYTKTSAGMVVLKGLVKAGVIGCTTPIATLPVGYRPEGKLIFENSSNSAAGRLDIDLNGEIRACAGSNAWFSLDGFTFMPSTSSFTPLSPLLNSWINFGSAHATAEYLTDSNGRVHVKGVVRNGTATSGTPIGNLPAGSRPPEYMHMVNQNSAVATHISIDNTGNVLAKGGSNSYLSLQAMFLPSGRATGATCTTQWCNLTLLNAWVWYGGIYSTPQYTKTADGMVLLKGLIRSGSSTIANLPAGYCPKQQQLLTVAAADAWGRLDITAGTGSGCTVVYASGSTVWFSLDAATWLAEW